MVVSLVGFAFLFGLILSRIGLPPMVGFLAAGFAYNLAGLGKPPGLETIADLGVTLLLFTIGLKLDLKALASAKIWGTSVIHVLLSTAFFAGILWLGRHLLAVELLQLSGLAIVVLAFALSFSSTVFAVKVLEEKGDMTALYGTVAIGILIMQDVFAVLFLAASEGKYPNLWVLSLLALPLLRKLLYRLLDAAGHGELLVLSGLFFALAAGYEYFQAMGLKGDLGALVIGVILANHPKGGELAKALFTFKELMLVGFFLSIGMQGLPTLPILIAALALCVLLPFKTLLYYAIVIRFGLRARTSLFASLGLANYSEFGLIVAALGVAQGWLSVDWLLVVAITVSLSFALAAPFSAGSESLYQRFKRFWERFQTSFLHPLDRPIETGEARVLVIGMGRVGTGAYDSLSPHFTGSIIGIEHDPGRVDAHREQGRQVVAGDATDTDFWTKLRTGEHTELIVLAMPNHHNNLYAAHQIRNAGLRCRVAAIAQFPEEVEELTQLGVAAFNMYSEAGSSLARQALDALAAPRQASPGQTPGTPPFSPAPANRAPVSAPT